MFGEQLLEEPLPSWLEVHVKIKDSWIKLPVDPLFLLDECGDEECLTDFFETHVRDLVEKHYGGSIRVKKVDITLTRKGLKTVYTVETSRGLEYIVLVVHRRDVSPSQIT